MMNVLGRILNSIRGSATNAAEAIADANAIPALQQNVRDGEAKIEAAKRDLAVLLGKVKVGERKLEELDLKIARDEQVVEKALDQGKDDLAQEVANRLVIVQQEAENERKSIASMKAAAVQLHGIVSTLTDQIKSVQREISQVQVTETVLAAQDAILDSGAGATGSINNASDALRRIKERQEGRKATSEARQQLADMSSGGDLDKRLASEGLLGGPASGQALIEKMKAKRAASLAAPDAQKALPAPEADKA